LELSSNGFEPGTTVIRSSQSFQMLMKKWLVWVIVGGPVLVYAIGKLLTR